MTAGGGVGSAGRWLQLLCKAKGWEYKGLGAVRMGENYLALFPCPHVGTRAADGADTPHPL
jgi:hypothetical protein